MISCRYQYTGIDEHISRFSTTKYVMHILVQCWISKSSWWKLCANVLQSCSPISDSNISKSSFNPTQTRLCSVAIQCSNSRIKTKSKIAKKEEKERSKWAKSPSFSLRTFLSVSLVPLVAVFVLKVALVSTFKNYFSETQSIIKSQKTDATFGEISKIVASMWDGLGENEKTVRWIFRKHWKSRIFAWLRSLQ